MGPTFWLQWQKQFEEEGKAPSLIAAHQILMSKLNGPTQQECNMVADALNMAISSLSTENDEWYLSLQSAISESMPNLTDLQIKDNFQTTTPALSKAWQEYSKLQWANKKALAQGLEMPYDIDTLNKAKKMALTLQGSVSRAKGQTLETFLAGLQETFRTIAENMITDSAESLANFLKQGIQNADFTTVTNTEGLLRNETITLNIDDEKFVLKGAQQKVDITLPSPFSGQSDWRITAKNYSIQKDVHLLSGGSFLRLLYYGVQPTNNDSFKFLLNALTIPSSNWTSANLNQLKKIFMIEAISGGQIDNLANVMVITLNNLKKPFRIISIPDLLTFIFKKNHLDAFIFEPILEKALPIGDKNARTEQDLEAIRNFTVNVTLSKSVLTLQYLKQLV